MMKLKNEFIFFREGKMATIELREDVGVKNIKEFYNELMMLLQGQEEIVLDFSQVRHVDLSLAQVLMAAHKIARKDNKVIKLKRVSQELKEQMQIAGLSK